MSTVRAYGKASVVHMVETTRDSLNKLTQIRGVEGGRGRRGECSVSGTVL
jgi:hypothetical protein